MQPSLSRDEFVALADRYPVVPLAVEVLADRETAVSVFERLTADGDGFLLESVEGGERWARWSFVGWDPAFTLVAREGRCVIEGQPVDLPSGDPLTVFESLLDRYRAPNPPMPGKAN
jgi:anthranilate synthase component 1